MLGGLLFFPLAFVFTSLVTHICSSLFENNRQRAVGPNALVRLLKLTQERAEHYSKTLAFTFPILYGVFIQDRLCLFGFRE